MADNDENLSELIEALRNIPAHTLGCPDDCPLCTGADVIEMLSTENSELRQVIVRASELLERGHRDTAEKCLATASTRQDTQSRDERTQNENNTHNYKNGWPDND